MDIKQLFDFENIIRNQCKKLKMYTLIEISAIGKHHVNFNKN